MRKGVLRNLAKFAGKHLRRRLFFNKVAGLKPATLLKKRLWHRCFPVIIAKFSTFLSSSDIISDVSFLNIVMPGVR